MPRPGLCPRRGRRWAQAEERGWRDKRELLGGHRGDVSRPIRGLESDHVRAVGRAVGRQVRREGEMAERVEGDRLERSGIDLSFEQGHSRAIVGHQARECRVLGHRTRRRGGDLDHRGHRVLRALYGLHRHRVEDDAVGPGRGRSELQRSHRRVGKKRPGKVRVVHGSRHGSGMHDLLS